MASGEFCIEHEYTLSDTGDLLEKWLEKFIPTTITLEVDTEGNLITEEGFVKVIK